MIVVRHCWLRYQPFPLTAQEAAAKGKVRLEATPTGEMQEQIGEPTVDPITGAQTPTTTQVPVTRQAVISTATNQEITPTIKNEQGKDIPHPDWPTRYGIRYILIVGNRAVKDEESPFPDSQLLFNQNILVPYSPYSRGEATRLVDLQIALNHVLSSIVNIQRYNAYPIQLMEQSVAQWLRKYTGEARANPAVTVEAPQWLIQQLNGLKNVITTIDPPTVPPDQWKLIEFLIKMIDQEGNMADVLQGKAPPGWSGEMAQTMATAATAVLKVKSLCTEVWLKRIEDMMRHCILKEMQPEHLARYLPQYPPHFVAAVHERMQGMQFTSTVQIGSGSGAAKAQETQNMVMARGKFQIPVSEPTILDNMNLNADAELAKQEDFELKKGKSQQRVQLAVQQDAQQRMMQMGMVPAAPAPPQSEAAAPEEQTGQSNPNMRLVPQEAQGATA
jgi:hypothetical protein